MIKEEIRKRGEFCPIKKERGNFSSLFFLRQEIKNMVGMDMVVKCMVRMACMVENYMLSEMDRMV